MQSESKSCSECFPHFPKLLNVCWGGSHAAELVVIMLAQREDDQLASEPRCARAFVARVLWHLWSCRPRGSRGASRLRRGRHCARQGHWRSYAGWLRGTRAVTPSRAHRVGGTLAFIESDRRSAACSSRGNPR